MHPESAYETLANNYVGDLEVQEPKNKVESFESDMRELRDVLKKQGFYKSSKAFYFQMVLLNIAILATSVITLYFYGHTTAGVLISATIMGLFWQQSGWLAHDFAHHQVFEDRSLNDAMVVFLGDFCLGFSLSWYVLYRLWFEKEERERGGVEKLGFFFFFNFKLPIYLRWKNKHNTHHAATNIHNFDPDVDTAPILMWSEHSSADFYEEFAPDNDMLSKFFAKYVHTHQSWYYYPVLSLSRLSWAHQSLLFSFSKGSLTKSAFMTFLERLILISHWVWYTYITFTYIPNSALNQLLFFLVSQVTCGYFLALVFVLNHNGMPVITEEQAMEMDFFTVQVITGRDVNPNILTNWFMGALNFQIEHHVCIYIFDCYFLFFGAIVCPNLFSSEFEKSIGNVGKALFP